MRRAFTLIELLVVIAIIAILAAILFPVFAAAKAAAKAAADLSNVKQLATACQIYEGDFDDAMPMQSGLGSTQWGWNHSIMTPWNWASNANADDYSYSVNGFANSIQPYAKNWDLFAAPGASKLDGFDDYQAYTLAINMVKYNTSYAYNGELSNYNATGVAEPVTCPIITEVNGFAVAVGIARSNPVLECPDPTTGCRYVPASANCMTTPPPNGTFTFMIPPFGVNWSDLTDLGVTQWTNKKGQNWAYCDGHAHFRQVALTVEPNGTTNAVTDFYKQFTPAGVVDPTGLSGGRTFWKLNTNGGVCHSYLMAPDVNYL